MNARTDPFRKRLTKNFSLHEFTRSQTATRLGIDNSLPEHMMLDIQRLASWLQALRDAISAHYEVEAPISISSGYRCTKLNNKVGGSKNSFHSKALAVDIECSILTTEELFQFIRSCMRFGQVIQEFDGWVHVSLNMDANQSENQALRATKVPRKFRKPKTVYTEVVNYAPS